MLDKIIFITKMEIFPTTTFIKNAFRTFNGDLEILQSSGSQRQSVHFIINIIKI
jgi:hypothetical protein